MTSAPDTRDPANRLTFLAAFLAVAVVGLAVPLGGLALALMLERTLFKHAPRTDTGRLLTLGVVMAVVWLVIWLIG